MNKNVFLFGIVMLLSFYCSEMYGISYSLCVGDPWPVVCPDPGPGKAVFQTAWSCSGQNAQYVKVTQTSNYGADITVTQYFSGSATVTCTYYYYWYSGSRQYTNHATELYTITCRSSGCGSGGSGGVTSVSVTPSDVDLMVGSTQQCYLSVTPSSASYTTSWSSGNTSIATVSSNGLITGTGTGTTFITATTNSSSGLKSGYMTVHVHPYPTGITMSATSISLNVGETQYLGAYIAPDYAISNITWTTSDANVAIYDNGSVVAVGCGTAIITATTSNGLTATCYVTVAGLPTSVSIPSNLNLNVGDTRTLTPTLTPSSCTTTYTWYSTNTSVVTVSSSGLVRAVSAGSASIYCKTANNIVSNYCHVTVASLPTSVSIPSSLNLNVGDTRTLTPTLIPSSCTTTYTWYSTNTNVVTVSSSGLVRAVSAGSASIYCKTANNIISNYCYVTVKNACPSPVLLSTQNVTESTADISWSAGDSETQWQYLFVESGKTVNWSGAVLALTPSASLSGLKSNTDYDFFVRSCCSNTDQSTPVKTTLHTAIELHNVTAVPNDATMGSASGGGIYDYGQTVCLTATAAQHYHFVGWSNGDTSRTICVPIYGDSTITAYFAIDRHKLTVNVNDYAMGSVAGGGVFDYGAAVTISAVPNNHYQFVRWNTGETTSSMNIIVNQDLSFTAEFEAKTYQVTANTNISNRGTAEGGGLFGYGTSVTLSATPNDGFEFTCWSNGETSNDMSFYVESDTTFVANFISIGTAVDNATELKCIAYSRGRTIFVCGVPDKSVYIYDMLGNIVDYEKEVCGEALFDVLIPGVYLVKIDNDEVIQVIVK